MPPKSPFQKKYQKSFILGELDWTFYFGSFQNTTAQLQLKSWWMSLTRFFFLILNFYWSFVPPQNSQKWFVFCLVIFVKKKNWEESSFFLFSGYFLTNSIFLSKEPRIVVWAIPGLVKNSLLETTVQLHELGNSDFSKTWAFRGTKEVTPQQLVEFLSPTHEAPKPVGNNAQPTVPRRLLSFPRAPGSVALLVIHRSNTTVAVHASEDVATWQFSRRLGAEKLSFRRAPTQPPSFDPWLSRSLIPNLPDPRRFICTLSDVEFTLTSFVEELQPDPWPVPPNRRPFRATGAIRDDFRSLLWREYFFFCKRNPFPFERILVSHSFCEFWFTPYSHTQWEFPPKTLICTFVSFFWAWNPPGLSYFCGSCFDGDWIPAMLSSTLKWEFPPPLIPFIPVECWTQSIRFSN